MLASGLGLSPFAGRSPTQPPMKKTARTAIQIQLSIHDQSVPLKFVPASACASTPATIGGTSGRAPLAVARPAPCPMSMKAVIGEQASPVRSGADDRARHRAVRGAVRSAHPRHEVVGDARPDGRDRAAGSDLAG